jgi:hypothetical protein
MMTGPDEAQPTVRLFEDWLDRSETSAERNTFVLAASF